MFVRLLIGLLLGYLGYRVIRHFTRLLKPPLSNPPPGGRVEAEELVQDPVCKTFIPRRDALTARKEGQDYYFCSEGCRKRFLK